MSQFNTKQQTLENEYQVLRNEFKNLHLQLLEKKEFQLASKLSEIYHKTNVNQYIQGIEFMKNLHQL